MNSRFASEGQVVELLRTLGKADVPYPADLLAKRRAAYLDKVESIIMLAGTPPSKGGGPQHPPSSSGSSLSGGSFLSSSGASLLTNILAVVLAAELLVGGYIMRNDLSRWIQFIFPTPVSAKIHPIVPSLPVNNTATLFSLSTTTGTGTVTPGITPAPTGYQPVRPTVITPAPPTPAPTHDNPGHHYGQTKNPKPTKLPKSPKPPDQ